MTRNVECPKCQDKMVQGFMPDYTFIARWVSSWVEGPPHRSYLSYIKVPIGGGVPIAAFRCKNCGYLEFYADNKFAAS